MNSREIVERTLNYENPERVARSFGDSDFVGGGCDARTHATGWKEISKARWERIDEWGNTWGRIDSTSKGEVTRGVLQDFSDLDSYEFPDYSDPKAYDRCRQIRKEHPDKWQNGFIPGFAFNIARKMRRLEQYLMDVLAERERISELHDRVDKVIEDMIRGYAAAGADGVMFPEDWGTQTQTLVSPALWREEYFPRFKKLCGIAEECGVRVFMHSCGQIQAIVPGLIEAGIASLQFDQPDLHGIDNLAANQELGKITFWCPVDIQKVLQTRDEKIIRDKSKEMLDKLWKGRGGFIAGIYPDNPSIGLDPKWQEYACDEFAQRGVKANYT